MVEPRHVTLLLIALFIGAIGLAFLFARRRRKEIALLAFALAVITGLSEIALRLVRPQVSQDETMFAHDRRLGWAFIPGKRGRIVYPGEANLQIETNSLGFRDREPDPGRKRRVAVIGDSFVTNISVELDSVFTEIMEASLDGTDVMNMGVNGYGQVQELLLLEQFVDVIKPDLVVVMIYVRNDFEDNLGGHWLYPRPHLAWNDTTGAFELLPPDEPAARPNALRRALSSYGQSHVFRLFETGVARVMERLRSDHRPSLHTPPELYLCRTDLSPETKRMYQAMEMMLIQLSSLLVHRNVPMVFVVAPSILQVEDERWAGALKTFGEDPANFQVSLPGDSIAAMANRHELPVIDLLPALRAEAARGTTLYNPKEQHWNRAGNRVVAGVLTTFVRSTRAGHSGTTPGRLP